MISREARIAKLKQQAAEMLRRAEMIESDQAKQQADEKRKADASAKLLLGAGVLMLDRPDQERTVAAVLTKLSPRDRGRVESWALRHDLNLTALPSPEPASSPSINDPEANTLKRVLGQFDTGGLSLLEAEFLGKAQGEDKAVLERLFVALNRQVQGKSGEI